MIKEENGVYRVTTHHPVGIALMAVGIMLAIAACCSIPVIPDWNIIIFIAVLAVVFLVPGVWISNYPKLVAELCGEGMTLHLWGVPKELIRWEEIESIYVYERRSGGRPPRNVRCVGITFVDLDAWLENRNFVQKNSIKLNVTMGYPPITLWDQSIDEPDAFVELCHGFLKKDKRITGGLSDVL